MTAGPSPDIPGTPPLPPLQRGPPARKSISILRWIVVDGPFEKVLSMLAESHAGPKRTEWDESG